MKPGMEPEVSCSLDNEDQFWGELDNVLTCPCDDSHAAIDNVLRAYLSLATEYKDAFLPSANDVLRCAGRLLASDLFSAHAEYVRRQIVYSLLQEETWSVLVVIVSLLLRDGRRNEATFEMLSAEGGFVRLLELIQSLRGHDDADGAGLHRLLMDLMYEMSRIQRIRIQDLVLVDDDFVKHLFEIIEKLVDDANDPYHYPVIRVLLVLNEQFMVCVHGSTADGQIVAPPTNRVIKVLSMYGGVYKTFGENIILLLNREDETSLQLLTLKLLYLLFTNPSTYEYFYTNDLRVLVDILIRNLLDLPEEAVALRHTYLRVLHPLLTHTQLRHPPHYKRDELQKLLGILVRSDFAGLKKQGDKILHFEEVDETTKRLVLRCSQVDWLVDEESEPSDEEVTVTAPPGDAQNTGHAPATLTTPTDGSQIHPPDSGTACSSSLSVAEASLHKEKATVVTRSKRDDSIDPNPAPQPPPPRLKPDPPQTRRSRARRRREENGEHSRQRDRSVTHQGRTVERQISFERIATSEPPSSHTNSSRDRNSSESTTIGTAAAAAAAAAITSSPTVDSPQESPTSAPKVPEIRVQHSSSSQSHPPAVPPPRRSSHSVPPPEHHSGVGRVRRHHNTPPPPPPPPPAHGSHPYPHLSSTRSRQTSSAQQVPSSPPPPPPPPTTTSSGKTNGHTKKPDPPKTRRWWTQQAAQRQAPHTATAAVAGEVKAAACGSNDGTGAASPTTTTPAEPTSVQIPHRAVAADALPEG